MENKNLEELKVKAVEHDMTDIVEADVEAVLEDVQTGVVDTYQSIEDRVVGTYKKVESGVVGAYEKLENKMVEKLFAKKGESVEDAKERLKNGKLF